MGVINNVIATQTSDFKAAGHHIYMLGGTWREMAGSEACSELGLTGGRVPNVDASTAMPRYRAVHGLMGQRALSACHDCSDGGLAVALAEMCIGGRLGANIDLDAVPAMEDMTLTELLYSESASRLIVSVRPDLPHDPRHAGQLADLPPHRYRHRRQHPDHDPWRRHRPAGKRGRPDHRLQAHPGLVSPGPAANIRGARKASFLLPAPLLRSCRRPVGNQPSTAASLTPLCGGHDIEGPEKPLPKAGSAPARTVLLSSPPASSMRVPKSGICNSGPLTARAGASCPLSQYTEEL